MKILRKLFILCLSLVLMAKNVSAEEASFSVVSVSDSSYSRASITVINIFGEPGDRNAYIGKELKGYAVGGGMFEGEFPRTGSFKWENPDYVIVKGDQYVNLICTIQNKSITLKLYLNGIDLPAKITPAPVSIEIPVTLPENEVLPVEEITPPSLTATSILLPEAASYDINIVDNTVGNKYTWSSSDTSIATVNSRNGIVKAVKPGKATITCKATLSDGKVHTLTSLVTVGEDDNAPVLTDSALDLSINDTYQINVENRIAKSNYKYASSDWSKLRVNSATGKIRAVGEGTAFVTCTITTLDNHVIILKCDVTIIK